jgi:uncharacterized protein (TIGR00268 family)
MSHIEIQLKKILKPYTSILVCLSGGLDSCLLLKEVHAIMNERVEAITFTSPLQTQRSIKDAKKCAKNLGVKHITVDYSPLIEKSIRINSKDRCYKCKTKMFSIAYGLASNKGKSLIILDGTHIGDDPLLRPGMKACKEFGICAPWRELGFGKDDIKRLAKDEGLYLWDRPTDSCLATRFPWDYNLTVSELRKLERVEEALREVGLKDFRFRPVDSPPRLVLSKHDYKIAQTIGFERIWDVIRERTGRRQKNFSVKIKSDCR